MFAESRSAGEQLLLTVSGSVPLTELEDLALGLLHLSRYKMGNLTDSVCPVIEGLKNPFFITILKCSSERVFPSLL